MTPTRFLAYALALAASVSLTACGGAEPIASDAAAIDAAVCQAQIADLRAKTDVVTYLSAQAAKDEAGLLTKLDNASLKLAVRKYADAVQKLTDYENQVVTLAANAKLADSADGLVTVQMLIDGAEAAKVCIIPPPPAPVP